VRPTRRPDADLNVHGRYRLKSCSGVLSRCSSGSQRPHANSGTHYENAVLDLVRLMAFGRVVDTGPSRKYDSGDAVADVAPALHLVIGDVALPLMVHDREPCVGIARTCLARNGGPGSRRPRHRRKRRCARSGAELRRAPHNDLSSQYE